MFRRLFEPAVELAQAAVELFARRVQAAAEEEPDQGELGAQRLRVHLGVLAVNEPLPEKTHQKLRHRDVQPPNTQRYRQPRLLKCMHPLSSGGTLHRFHLQFEGLFALAAPAKRFTAARPPVWALCRNAFRLITPATASTPPLHPSTTLRTWHLSRIIINCTLMSGFLLYCMWSYKLKYVYCYFIKLMTLKRKTLFGLINENLIKRFRVLAFIRSDCKT